MVLMKFFVGLTLCFFTLQIFKKLGDLWTQIANFGRFKAQCAKRKGRSITNPGIFNQCAVHTGKGLFHGFTTLWVVIVSSSHLRFIGHEKEGTVAARWKARSGQWVFNKCSLTPGIATRWFSSLKHSSKKLGSIGNFFCPAAKIMTSNNRGTFL